MVTKFFQNSNFSDFLGIKSEINQYSDWQVYILAFSIDKDVIEWNPLAPFKILSVFADAGFHSSEKTSTLNPPPISYNDWNWSNFSEIEQYGNFSAKELGDVVNEAEFSMEFLLTGSWELHILRIFDEFTTDYKQNFIDSKSSLNCNRQLTF